MTTRTAPVDPITLSVVQNALTQITSEMDATLVRTAFSPVISEAQDRASGIYSLSGEVIAQGPTSLPLFINTMQDTVKAAIASVDDLAPGDVLILNDPYMCGLHMMDMRLVTPFFYRGELRYYLADTGHWTDVGGMTPGSFCGTATEVVQEGVRLTPIRIVANGELRRDVLDLILSNLRVPTSAEGDLKAQLAALKVGERRLTELLDKYGEGVVGECIEELEVRAEAGIRSHISDIPDGRYEADSYLDNDGLDPEPIKVHLTIDVRGDELHCSFEGSSGWVRGPFNSTVPTARAGVFIGLMHLFPDVMPNAGFFRPVQIDVPSDTFLNAPYPKAVSGSSGEVSSAVADATLHAFCSIAPASAVAGCYQTMAAFTLGGVDPLTGKSYVLYSFNGGGYGGSPIADGLTNAPLPVGCSQAPPVEVTELQYPLVFEEYRLRENSAGAGEFRGGLGVHYEVRLLRGDAQAAVFMNNGVYGPWGADGGTPGAVTQVSFVVKGEQFSPPLLTKLDGVRFSPGDRLIVDTPGGGGWGSPRDRPAESLEVDFAEGYLSADALLELYGWTPGTSLEGERQ
jgi:N-methylhydantoinase B